MKRGVWALTFAAAVNYAVLVWVGMDAMGGQKPLDLYYFGYSYDDVMRLLTRLDFESALFVGNTVRMIDTSFPILFGLALAGWIWIGAQGRSLLWRLAVLVPLAYTAADLYENQLIAQILTGMLPSPELVERASLITMVKFGLVVLSGLVLFGAASGGDD